MKFKTASYVLAHRKFGFDVRLLESANGEEGAALSLEMIERLNKGIKIAERLLQPFIKEQINQGNLSIKNRSHLHEMRYRYFRDQAKQCFEADPPPPQIIMTDNPISPEMRYFDSLKPEREGSFAAIAMIDAYYSKLEHILFLLAPFHLNTHQTKLELITFLEMKWVDKFKALFPMSTIREAKRHFDALLNVKINYRNPLAHGLLEKGGSSLFFHFPDLGPIPVRLSRHRDSIYDSFNPIKIEDYDYICNVFDAFDDFLSNGPTKLSMRYIEAGFLVNFDKDSVANYQEALRSEEHFESFLEYCAHLDSMYTNMDW